MNVLLRMLGRLVVGSVIAFLLLFAGAVLMFLFGGSFPPLLEIFPIVGIGIITWALMPLINRVPILDVERIAGKGGPLWECPLCHALNGEGEVKCSVCGGTAHAANKAANAAAEKK